MESAARDEKPNVKKAPKTLDSSNDTVYNRNSYGSETPDPRSVRTARVIKRALNLIVKHLEAEYGA